MNLLIKFRGKRLDNGEWVYGSLVGIEDTAFIINQDDIDWNPNTGIYAFWFDNQDCLVKSETVGQFTGFLDRNETEIYDGDILNVRICAEEIPMVVCFINGSWCIHEDYNYEEFHYLYDYCYDATIIGNIHDNPELLEQSFNK